MFFCFFVFWREMSGAVVVVGVAADLEAELRGSHASLYAFQNCAVRHTLAVGGRGLTATGKGYSKQAQGKMKLVCVDPACQASPRVARRSIFCFPALA
jgi:hypothetical protein